MNVELRNNLVGLLLETGRAHHAAFSATDGADPDWPKKSPARNRAIVG